MKNRKGVVTSSQLTAIKGVARRPATLEKMTSEDLKSVVAAVNEKVFENIEQIVEEAASGVGEVVKANVDEKMSNVDAIISDHVGKATQETIKLVETTLLSFKEEIMRELEVKISEALNTVDVSDS